jgi:hypothetical protein
MYGALEPSIIMYGNPVVLERAKLYAEVWTDPVCTVAKRYGISDVALAKNCRKLGIPLPPRGYWAKLKAGKHPRQSRLPKLKRGESDRTVLWQNPSRSRPQQPEGLEQAVPIEVDPEIVVSETLEEPHELVARTAKFLTRSTSRTSGTERVLSIDVSPLLLDRALRIMDALLKAMEHANLQIEVLSIGPVADRPPSYGYTRPKPQPAKKITRVRCEDEWIEFAISERLIRVVDPKPKPHRESDGYVSTYSPTTYTYKSTGELTLSLKNVDRLGIRASWKDGKQQRVEDCLPGFVANLSRVALAMRLRREGDNRSAAAAREAALQREQAQLRTQQDLERVEGLRGDLERWRLARDIRDYVAQAHSILRGVDQRSPAGLELRWRYKWATAYADRLDPLTELRDQVRHLEEDDRDEPD